MPIFWDLMKISILVPIITALGCSNGEKLQPANPVVVNPSPVSSDLYSRGFREVFRDSNTNYSVAEKMYSAHFNSQEEVNQYLTSIGIAPDSALASYYQFSLDFSKETGIVVVLPLQSNTGPGIRVTQVIESGPCLNVEAEKFESGQPGVGGATITRPFVYIAVPKNTRPICYSVD